MFKWYEKHEDSPTFIMIMFLGIFLIAGSIVGGMFFFKNAEEARVEALDGEELLIYNIENSEYESTTKELVEEYIDLKEIENLKDVFNDEDFTLIKEEYNAALEYLYFEQEYSGTYDVKLAIIDSQGGENEYSSSAIENFLNINRGLLSTKLDEKLFIEGAEMIEYRVEQTEIAEEASRDIEREERKIYITMKNAFDKITNYGENYVPEVHDDIVAKAASDTFGITVGEANRIYINGEMGEY